MKYASQMLLFSYFREEKRIYNKKKTLSPLLSLLLTAKKLVETVSDSCELITERVAAVYRPSYI